MSNAENVLQISEIAKRIALAEDTERATCAVALLNTFLTTVHIVGKRQMFTTKDFIAYGTALAALDSIMPAEPSTAEDYGGMHRARTEGLHAVESALASTAARLPRANFG